MTGAFPQQLTVHDATLTEWWSDFLHEYCKAAVEAAALEWPDVRSITVNFNDIQLRNPDLAETLLQKPSHALRVGESMLHQIDVPVDPRPLLRLRVTGLPESQRIQVHRLRAEHLGRFVAVEGRIQRTTEVDMALREAMFECKRCTTRVRLLQEDEFQTEPGHCETCETQTPWRLLEEESDFKDYQKVKLEENRDDLRGSTQPEGMTVHFWEDIVQTVVSGDRVRINGILTAKPRRQAGKKRIEHVKILQVVSVEVQEHAFENIEISQEDEQNIEAAASDPAIYDRFRASFSPTIFGMEVQKDALIMSLFGGVAKTYKDGSRLRGDIHVLLVGDPGVAKSQLLRYLSKLAPRAILASGKGASAAGLTATAVKDDFGGGGWTYEAGALVLADNGIACIDELDKMDKNDQSAMHPAMEQQEFTVSKAPGHALFKSRCAVVGAANPKLGRFDEYESLHAQINMPPALLSRFDLIFSILDKPAREKDGALAGHILQTHRAGAVREHRRTHPTGPYSREDEEALSRHIAPDMDPEFIRKYVAYAKRYVIPVATDEAIARIQHYYQDLRNSGDGSIPFTARQVEGLQRLMEASARIRLSQEATIEDAERAIGIVEAYMKSVGVDRETGRFDIDVVTTGVSHSQHDRLRKIQDIIGQLTKESPRGYAREQDILSEAQKEGIDAAACQKGLETLKRNNSIYSKGGTGTYAPLKP